MRARDKGEAGNHKVVLLGDSKVGKTSILCQQLNGYHMANQNPTIGCHCNDLTIFVEDKPVTMQLWDTAGQEMYRALVPVYVRGASAAIIVYDVTERNSFTGLKTWVDLIHDKVPGSVPIYIVGNKTDLTNATVVSDQEARAFAESIEASLYKTSALMGLGISELFHDIALALSKSKTVDALAIDPESNESRKGCC